MSNQLPLEWGPDEGAMTWAVASARAATKGNGWRLPTVEELAAQYDFGKCQPAAGFHSDWYWTSSLCNSVTLWGGTATPWTVGFSDTGMSCYCVRINDSRVRFVREVKP